MSTLRFLVVVILASSSVGFTLAQGRSGRDAPRAGGTQPRIEQRVEARAEQALQQQTQRRASEEARRSVERRAAAAEIAARSAARRSARDSNRSAELRKFAKSRGIRPELFAEKASEHADIHAAIAVGMISNKPIQFNDEQRAKLKEVFGDADLLEPRKSDVTGRSNRTVGSETASTDNELSDDEGGSVRPTPGSRANANARLANAIRVRRAQISELRDQAIESGDQKLMERADQLEKTLDIFLVNQARVESNLAEVEMRPRGSFGSGEAMNVPPVADSTIRTAELDVDDGLIQSE